MNNLYEQLRIYLPINEMFLIDDNRTPGDEKEEGFEKLDPNIRIN